MLEPNLNRKAPKPSRSQTSDPALWQRKAGRKQAVARERGRQNNRKSKERASRRSRQFRANSISVSVVRHGRREETAPPPWEQSERPKPSGLPRTTKASARLIPQR